ncbi:MAG: hypothetical protein HZB55_24230 [Deltaproteobacteria bacterium]|nr:hypothetical protein [Deltaproteobacteria bacterium]
MPECGDGDERVGLELRGKKIQISATFVRKTSRAVSPAEVLDALLDHAVSHYVCCPWDFSTHLGLYLEAKRALPDSVKAKRATDSFLDVVADTYSVNRGQTALPEVYRTLRRDALEETVHGLCQRIWGVDLGAAGDEDLIRKLSSIPYLERRNWKESIREYVRTIEPLLEAEPSSGEVDRPSPFGSHSLEQYTADEIEAGLRALTRETEDLTDFQELLQDFGAELREALPSLEHDIGTGRGRPAEADFLFYRKLSENYRLPVQKAAIEKAGALYPHHHVPWEAGTPFQDVDPWTSFGRLLPGITQSWRRIDGETLGSQPGVPDCLVVLDSSASMVNPRERVSWAVVGAACAADAYLRNQAKVAVYNFGDAQAGERRVLPYTTKRREIVQALCHFHGGGTRLDVQDIERLQHDPKPDIIIITDMKIINLESIIEYFLVADNRVTVIYTGLSDSVRQFERATTGASHMQVLPIENDRDIPKIVLGRSKTLFLNRVKR